MTAKRPRCDTPGCGRTIPVGGEGHPEICPTCLRAETAIPKVVPPAWRVGKKVGRTLYLNNVLVGLMDTEELARTVVAAMNAAPAVEIVKGTQGASLDDVAEAICNALAWSPVNKIPDVWQYLGESDKTQWRRAALAAWKPMAQLIGCWHCGGSGTKRNGNNDRVRCGQCHGSGLTADVRSSPPSSGAARKACPGYCAPPGEACAAPCARAKGHDGRCSCKPDPASTGTVAPAKPGPGEGGA